MSEVKRYNTELEKDGGLGLPSLTMRSSSIGSWVEYKDYADLEAKCAALAAELKQSKIDAECYKHGMEQSNKRLTEIAAENAALKSAGCELLGEACAVYAKLNKLINQEIGDFVDGQTLHEFQFLLDTGTTNTDAWVNEQRAVGVDSAIESAKKEIASEFQYQSFDNCISACARHPQSDLSGKVEMVAWLEWFAAQLRGSQV